MELGEPLGPQDFVGTQRGEEQKGVCWAIWSGLEDMGNRRNNPKKRVESQKSEILMEKDQSTAWRIWSKSAKDSYPFCPILPPPKVTGEKTTLWCHLMVQGLPGLHFAK